MIFSDGNRNCFFVQKKLVSCFRCWEAAAAESGMRILYAHTVFPGAFGPLVRYMAAGTARVSVFMAERWAREAQIPGVRRVRMAAVAPASPSGTEAEQAEARFALSLKAAARAGEVFTHLRKGGFTPDVIYADPEEGYSLFAKDVFPHVRLVIGVNRLYEGVSSETGEGQAAMTLGAIRGRIHNMLVLSALQDCDQAIAGFGWQRRLFKAPWQDRIAVVKPGIDTRLYQPLGCHPHRDEATFLIYGVGQNHDFSTLCAAVPMVLAMRPTSRVRIVSFASARAEEVKRRHEATIRSQLHLDERCANRVEIVAAPSLSAYREALQTSGVLIFHAPTFALSGGALEAMSCGGLVMAANTEAARDVIRHGENGFLHVSGDAAALAGQVAACLTDSARLDGVRQAARECILEQHDLRLVIPHHAALVAGCHANLCKPSGTPPCH